MTPTRHSYNIRRVLVLALISCLAGTAAWYLHTNDPSTGEAIFAPCVFNELTGIHCPGCGSTRAGHDLLNGRILEAVNHNLFFVGAALFLPWPIARMVNAWARNTSLEHKRSPLIARLLKWLPSFVITFTLLRNIPIPIFSWLAP